MAKAMKICCCSASGWSKAIGWLQSLGCTGLLIFCTVTFIKLPHHAKHLPDLPQPNATPDFFALDSSHSEKFKNYYDRMFEIICIVLTAVNLTFALILLFGVYKRITGLLTTWIVVMAISTGLEIAATVLESRFLGAIGPLAISRCCGILAARAFAMWVVAILKGEIHAANSAGSKFAAPVTGYDADKAYTV